MSSVCSQINITQISMDELDDFDRDNFLISGSKLFPAMLQTRLYTLMTLHIVVCKQV